MVPSGALTGSDHRDPLPVSPLVTLGMGMLLIAAIAWWFAETVADPDLWGHVKFGEVVWRARAVVQVDPFSYVTSGRPWMNHEWLPEVLFYLADSWAGPRGLIALKLTVLSVIAVVAYAHLIRTRVPFWSAALIVAAAMWIGTPGFFPVRPLLATALFFLLTLIAIHRMSRGATLPRWGLPALFLVWANMHPGFLAGLGALGVWATVEAVIRLDPRAPEASGAALTVPQMAAVVVGSAAATLANPFGFHLWEFLARTSLGVRPEIMEWESILSSPRLGLASPVGRLYLAFLAVVGVAVIASRARRRPGEMAVLGVCALLPLVAVRHVQLALLALVVLGGEHVYRASRRAWLALGLDSLQAPNVRRTWFGGCLCVLSLVVLAHVGPRARCIHIRPSAAIEYPVQAVARLHASGVTANLALDFDWGLYAIYHLGDRIKVSIDGRRETGYDLRQYWENHDLVNGTGDWDALLRRGTTDLVLLRSSSPTVARLRTMPAWTVLHEDGVAVLFARTGSEISRRVLAVAPPPLPASGEGLCYP